jgi:hypothetical protein
MRDEYLQDIIDGCNELKSWASNQLMLSESSRVRQKSDTIALRTRNFAISMRRMTTND